VLSKREESFKNVTIGGQRWTQEIRREDNNYNSRSKSGQALANIQTREAKPWQIFSLFVYHATQARGYRAQPTFLTIGAAKHLSSMIVLFIALHNYQLSRPRSWTEKEKDNSKASLTIVSTINQLALYLVRYIY
jgi:hypothetical protein